MCRHAELKLFYHVCPVNQRYRDNTLAHAELDHQQEITLSKRSPMGKGKLFFINQKTKRENHATTS